MAYPQGRNPQEPIHKFGFGRNKTIQSLQNQIGKSYKYNSRGTLYISSTQKIMKKIID